MLALIVADDAWKGPPREPRGAARLFFAFYNFCRVHQTLKTTPAVAAGLATEAWSVQRLLDEAGRG